MPDRNLGAGNCGILGGHGNLITVHSSMAFRVPNLLDHPSLESGQGFGERSVPSRPMVQRNHSQSHRQQHPPIRTDYPGNSYGFYSTEPSAGTDWLEGGGRGGGGIGGVTYRLPKRNPSTSDLSCGGENFRRNRTNSMDRSSYEGSQSSFSGSLAEAGYNSRQVPVQPASESGYRANPMLLLDNSCLTDFTSK